MNVPQAGRARLIELIDEVDPSAIAALPLDSLIRAVRHAADFAWYWQEPDHEDQLLGDETVIEALRPIAEALVVSPEVSWWGDRVDISQQRLVEYYGPRGWPKVALFGGLHHLEVWRDQTLASETRARRELSADPTEMYSGNWWSIPAMSDTPFTTKDLGPLGTTGLQAVEDSLGWEEARIWSVRVRDEPNILEINSPDDWRDLVEKHPLDVTASRRHDWFRATGQNRNWLIPDWASVATQYDAVHVTIFGYLTTAGRAIPVRNGATVLAGWNPDATYWLHRDFIQFDGDAVEWILSGENWRQKG